MSLEPEWYDNRELAKLYAVKTSTVRHWLWLARKHGRGPTPSQVRKKPVLFRTQPIPRIVRVTSLRGDYVVALYEFIHRRTFRPPSAAL